MSRPLVALACLILALLAGCQTPPLSREETQRATQRTYTGIEPETVLRAAEQVLLLADGSDFTLQHGRAEFLARRKWLVYVVIGASFGYDYWHVTTERRGTETAVRVRVATSSVDLVPFSVTPQVWTTIAMPPNADFVRGDAIYDVFFARLDYLLGLRDTWMTCREADARVSAGTTRGDNSALCNAANMADKTPAGPMIPRDQQAPAAKATATPSQTAVAAPAAPARPAVTPVGKDSFVAERLARETGCARDPVANLVGKGPGYETFSLQCANGETLVLRCEFGNCRALK